MPNTSVLGVVLTDTPATNEKGFQLGQRVTANDGQEYVYVQASAAITQYYWVGIDENFAAAPLTTAMAGDGWQVGVAQVAFASSDYGWVATRGHNLSGFVKLGCAADVSLYTSTVPGQLDDSASLGTKIDGVVQVAAAPTIAAAVEVLVTYPRPTTF